MKISQYKRALNPGTALCPCGCLRNTEIVLSRVLFLPSISQFLKNTAWPKRETWAPNSLLPMWPVSKKIILSLFVPI